MQNARNADSGLQKVPMSILGPTQPDFWETRIWRVFTVILYLKPNSITLAGSKLVGDQLRTSFEPDGVMEFCFYAARFSVNMTHSRSTKSSDSARITLQTHISRLFAATLNFYFNH